MERNETTTQEQPVCQTGDGRPNEDEQQRETHAQTLLRLARKVELFTTPGNKKFATVEINNHRENWPIRSSSFESWLRRQFFKTRSRPPCQRAVKDTLAQLEAKAQFNGLEREIHIRVAGGENAVYLDLANKSWEAVKITPMGWHLLTTPPLVRFCRTGGMKPLPRPVKGGSLKDLADLLNLPDEESRILVISWLLGALRPKGPYPILVLEGEQGSAKSTTARMLRSVIDPFEAAVRSAPRDERDLFISANNSWVLAFDNLSRLHDRLSDAMCRLSTGGGFATRKLYSDDDELILNVTRPIILNGIDHIVERHDLQDRTIIIELCPIAPHLRRPERELWARFESALPGILGALCNSVSTALGNFSNITFHRLPRMADFATWVLAAEQALPWEPGAFLQAYKANREGIIDLALESNPVATALRAFMTDKSKWQGTSTELLTKLNGISRTTDEAFPRGASSLSRELKRVATFLGERHIHVERQRTGRERLILIRKEG